MQNIKTTKTERDKLEDSLFPDTFNFDIGYSIRNSITILRRGSFVAGLVFLVTLLTVVLYSIITPKDYVAYALILIDGNNSSHESEPINSGKIYSPGFTGKNVLENQTLILRQSILIAQRTAKRLLEDRKNGIVKLTMVSDTVQDIDKIAKRIQKDYITVALAEKQVDIIKISAKSTNPKEASLIANYYTDEYIRFTHELGQKRIISSREFLENQIADRKKELISLENQIKQYKSRNGAVALDKASGYTISQIAQLEASLDDAKIQKSMHEASLNSLENELKQIHPLLAKRIASGVDQEIKNIQSKIAEYELLVEQIYMHNPALRNDISKNIQLVSLTEQIAQLKKKVQELSEQYISEIMSTGGIDPANGSNSATNYITNLNSQIVKERIAISGMSAKVNALKQRLEASRLKLESIPEQAMKIAQLERARQSTERLYVLLTERLQETKIKEKIETGGISVIRKATVPIVATHPNIPRNIAFGLALAFLLGIGSAFLKDKLDTKIYEPDDIENVGINVISAIPDLSKIVETEFNGEKTVLFNGKNISTNLVSLVSSDSFVAESYRKLLLNIRYINSKNATTLLVTSSNKQSGKSILASNIALVSSMDGKKTLLIDANLYSPSLHELFKVNSDIDADIENINGFKTDIENLFIVTGHKVDNFSKRIATIENIKNLVKTLKSQFDLIVLDASSTQYSTDSAVLSDVCDITIMSVLSGVTKSDELLGAVNELRKSGIIVAGAVLSKYDF